MKNVDPTQATPEWIDKRYRKVAKLGSGTFGRVILVEDTFHADARLALKVIRAELLGTPDLVDRFSNEIRILRALVHENIPRIVNDGRTPEGESYFTMEYVEGCNLEDELSRLGRLDDKTARAWGEQLADALAYAHAQGVVHRDLKPANVLVGADSRLWVLDFGIARVLRNDAKIAQLEAVETLGPLGTPRYMSPEQRRGDPVDERSDVYSLGLILWKMLSGAQPTWVATSSSTGAPPLRRSDRTLAALVARMLAHRASDRPGLDEVRAVLTAGPRKATTSRRLSAALTLAGVSVLAVFAAFRVLAVPDEQHGSGVAAQGTERSSPLELPAPRSVAKEPDSASAAAPQGDRDATDDVEGDPAASVPPAVPPQTEPAPTPEAPPIVPAFDGEMAVTADAEVHATGLASAGCVGPEARALDLDESGRFSFWVKVPLGISRIELISSDGDQLDAMAVLRHPPSLQVVPGAGQDDEGWPKRLLHTATGYELVLLPRKEVVLGDGDGPPLRLDRPAWIGRTEVSRRHASVWASSTGHGHLTARWSDGDDELPATGLRWDEARDFARWSGLELPTEALWEYAARAGSAAPYPWGFDPAAGGAYANLAGRGEDLGTLTVRRTYPCEDGHAGLAPVDALAPSDWGLHGLVGNAAEWCANHGSTHLQLALALEGLPTPGRNVVDPPERTVRGASYGDGPSVLPLSRRKSVRETARQEWIGFRCAWVPALHAP